MDAIVVDEVVVASVVVVVDEVVVAIGLTDVSLAWSAFILKAVSVTGAISMIPEAALRDLT
jgi:hypothetical protein